MSLMCLAHARTWSCFQVLPSSSEIHSVQYVSRTVAFVSHVSPNDGRYWRQMKDMYRLRRGQDEAVRIKNKTVASPSHCNQRLLSRPWARCWVLRAPMAVTMAQTLMQGWMAMAMLISAGQESPGPLLTPVRLHTQVSSESRLFAHGFTMHWEWAVWRMHGQPWQVSYARRARSACDNHPKEITTLLQILRRMNLAKWR